MCLHGRNVDVSWTSRGRLKHVRHKMFTPDVLRTCYGHSMDVRNTSISRPARTFTPDVLRTYYGRVMDVRNTSIGPHVRSGEAHPMFHARGAALHSRVRLPTGAPARPGSGSAAHPFQRVSPGRIGGPAWSLLAPPPAARRTTGAQFCNPSCHPTACPPAPGRLRGALPPRGAWPADPRPRTG